MKKDIDIQRVQSSKQESYLWHCYRLVVSQRVQFFVQEKKSQDSKIKLN